MKKRYLCGFPTVTGAPCRHRSALDPHEWSLCWQHAKSRGDKMKVELVRAVPVPPPVTEVVLRMTPGEARSVYNLLKKEAASANYDRNWSWSTRRFFEDLRDGMKDAS